MKDNLQVCFWNKRYERQERYNIHPYQGLSVTYKTIEGKSTALFVVYIGNIRYEFSQEVYELQWIVTNGL